MLPVVDKPLIQYAVEEAVAAGATKLVFITGSTKRAIEDHFDDDPELERALADSGKTASLESITNVVPKDVACVFIRQGVPLGLGHAVLCAEPAVGNEPFFVHLADDLIASDTPCLKQMASFREKNAGSVLAVQEVAPERTSSYGIVALEPNNPLQRIVEMVEKPAPEDAPTNLAVVGRYLLEGSMFDHLRTIGRGAGGEIQLTDAIAQSLAESPVYAYPFEGTRYDCGSKLGFLTANVELALGDPDLGPRFKRYLQELDLSD